MNAFEVDVDVMRDALSDVPGVEQVMLEFDPQGNGVLRVQVWGDHEQVVGAAVARVRRRFGLGLDSRRLRLTGPSGRPVVAVVESLPVPESPFVGAHRKIAAEPEPPLVPAQPLGESAAPDLGEPDPAEPAIPVPEVAARTGARRVVVERIEFGAEHGVTRVKVTLRSGADLHDGTAYGPDAGSEPHRTLVAATVRAVESVVASRARLVVEQVDLLQVGPDLLAVVVLALLTPRGVDRLTGSALVRTDDRDSVVRATLDALNRRAKLAGRP